MAKTAANIAGNPSTFKQADLSEKVPADYYRISRTWEDAPVEEKVTKVNASLSDESSTMLFYNSGGKLTYDYRPLASLMARCVMEKNGQIENSYSSRSYRKGFEWLGDDLIEEIAREAVDNTSILFDATRPKASEMPVVLGAGGSGIHFQQQNGQKHSCRFHQHPGRRYHRK